MSSGAQCNAPRTKTTHGRRHPRVRHPRVRHPRAETAETARLAGVHGEVGVRGAAVGGRGRRAVAHPRHQAGALPADFSLFCVHGCVFVCVVV